MTLWRSIFLLILVASERLEVPVFPITYHENRTNIYQISRDLEEMRIDLSFRRIFFIASGRHQRSDKALEKRCQSSYLPCSWAHRGREDTREPEAFYIKDDEGDVKA